MLPDRLITSENRISFAELARREGVSPAAVHRWHAATDPPLPATKIGRKFYTSLDAVDWWMGERARRDYEKRSTSKPTPNATAPSHADIDAECRRAGI